MQSRDEEREELCKAAAVDLSTGFHVSQCPKKTPTKAFSLLAPAYYSAFTLKNQLVVAAFSVQCELFCEVPLTSLKAADFMTWNVQQRFDRLTFFLGNTWPGPGYKS